MDSDTKSQLKAQILEFRRKAMTSRLIRDDMKPTDKEGRAAVAAEAKTWQDAAEELEQRFGIKHPLSPQPQSS